MLIFHLLIIIVLIGVALWFVNQYVPMAAPIKTLLNIVVVVGLCLWVLEEFGLFDYSVPVHHVLR